MDLSKIIDWVKLPPKLLLGIALAAAILLFAPDPFASTLGLLEFRAQFRPWIGAAFVIAIGLFSAHVLDPGWNSLRAAISRRKAKGVAMDRLRKLTPNEKIIIRAYVENQTRTRYWQIEDGVVRGLEAASILYKASESPNWAQYGRYAFNVQNLAWEILGKHPELVED